MPGIIHFDRLSRRPHPVTRRSLVFGTLGSAGALTVRSMAGQVPATPGATPDGGTDPEAGVFSGKARERLEALLSLVPQESLGGPDPTDVLFSWVDVQTQLLAFGAPDVLDDPALLNPIFSPLYVADPLSPFATESETKELFGFSPLEVHQTLVMGSPPDQVTMYAGGMPVDQLPAAWEAAGYVYKHGDEGDYWTIGEDGKLDLVSPVGRVGAGLLNNIAIVNDDVVVFAPRIELLRSVQAQANDAGRSAADRDDVATLLEVMPTEAVSVVAMPGAGLDAATIVPENPGAAIKETLMDLLAESDDAVGPMPESELAFFGITAGGIGTMPVEGTPAVSGNPDAYIFVDTLMTSPDDAAQAERVVNWRIEHMISPTTGYVYNELLVPDASARRESSGPVASFAFTSPTSLSVWTQMISARDLWPFVYLAGE